MTKILVQSAWETIQADGWKVFTEQTMRYFMLYGNPINIGDYWWNRTFGDKFPIVPIQGSFMRLDLRDRGIHADLYINGIREPQATRRVQEIIRPDWTVIDIGANIGYYALMESLRAKKVIAIEPGPDNFRNLARNVQINGSANVDTYNLAIGNREGEIGFEIAKACNWNRIATDGKGDVKVPMTTLDKFVAGHGIGKVDFVRMDVEGYEMAILAGMQDVLKQHAPDMFIEVHRDRLKDYGHSQLELMEFLAAFGYSISASYISAREGPTGKISDLLSNATTRRMITERGIASHMFFSRSDKCN